MVPHKVAPHKRVIDNLNIKIGADALEKLAWFAVDLERWNKRLGLVGTKHIRQIIPQHIADSLSVLQALPGGRILDLGTGAGLPGLPLAIVDSSRHYVLIDRSERRLAFVRHVVARLGLGHVRVCCARAEELPAQMGDGVVARALIPPVQTLKLAAPLVSPGGRILLMQARETPAPAPPGFEPPTTVAAEVPGVAAPRWLWLYDRAVGRKGWEDRPQPADS